MVEIDNFFENIVSKKLTVTVSKKTLKYYNDLKYNVKLNDIITIPIEHLSLGSNQKILVKCTNCGDLINITYNNYVNIMKKGNNYICKKCNTFEKTVSQKYGVKNIMELDKYKIKIQKTKLNKYNDKTYNNREQSKKTSINKYGCEYFSSTNIFKEKYKNTILEKYNVDNISKDNEIKKKKKNTLKSNYDVYSIFSLENIQNKKNVTVKNKYNVDNVFQLDWVKEKSKNTMIDKYGINYLTTLPNKRYLKKYDDRFNLYYQGTYEKDFLNFCFNNNIEILKPKYINYIFNNKEYKYFPDFYYKPTNLLIEIKSDYTFQIQKEKNLTKQQYCLQNGFNYIFIINKNYFEFTKIIEKNV